MLIAIVGTRCSGKSTVADFLSSKGFRPVRLRGVHRPAPSSPQSVSDIPAMNHAKAVPIYPATPHTPTHVVDSLSDVHKNVLESCLFRGSDPQQQPLDFISPAALLEHVTQHWRADFVTLDLNTKDLIEVFVRRPFFMLIKIDAPLLDRFKRRNALKATRTPLEDFILENDTITYGPRPLSGVSSTSLCGIDSVDDLVKLDIINSFESRDAFLVHLEALNLPNPARLRPSWDDYFMTLASLASRRSNCIKRRVGAILVRDNRVLATGYNGTPRGLVNCNDGGCTYCNRTSLSLECVCLHAEENALLEAGRERIGDRAVLYCNTCPCLRCTTKIIQTGVKEVVYNLSYKVDDASATLFKEAGVQLRRHRSRVAPP